MAIEEKFKERFPKMRQQEPLKNHCTFRVGGPADFFYELHKIEELPPLIILAEENTISYRLIGRGTNILFTDKGFRGLIIKNLTKMVSFFGNEIGADSGALLAQIIRLAVDNNLSGLEPLYGLPGSIGAAVWGNAGIPETEIGMFVKSATLFNAADGIREVPGGEIAFDYRSTSLQKTKDVVLRVTLQLQKGSAHESKELMKKIDEIRRGKQPIGYSAGSFFKNPPPEQVHSASSSRSRSAGFLIDQAGLKGACIGDAQISEKHANFFINKGHCTALELLELAAMARKKVKEKFGIDLEMEVKIVGEGSGNL